MVEKFQHELEPKRKPSYKNFYEAYQAVVGIPFVEHYEQLPPVFTLPPAAYGELINSILAQETDQVQGIGPRERSQMVGFLNFKGEVNDTRVSIGTEKRANNAPLIFGRWFRPFIGLQTRPITFWHTHSPTHSPVMTVNDVILAASEDRDGGIYAVGSQADFTAIVRTKESFPKIIPVSTFKKGMDMLDEVNPLFDDTDLQLPYFPQLAAFLARRGLGLYRWHKGSHQSLIEAAKSGALTDGIPLVKVT